VARNLRYILNTLHKYVVSSSVHAWASFRHRKTNKYKLSGAEEANKYLFMKEIQNAKQVTLKVPRFASFKLTAVAGGQHLVSNDCQMSIPESFSYYCERK